MAQVSRVPNTGRMQNKEHHAARAGLLLQPRLNSCHMGRRIVWLCCSSAAPKNMGHWYTEDTAVSARIVGNNFFWFNSLRLTLRLHFSFELMYSQLEIEP